MIGKMNRRNSCSTCFFSNFYFYETTNQTHHYLRSVHKAHLDFLFRYHHHKHMPNLIPAQIPSNSLNFPDANRNVLYCQPDDRVVCDYYYYYYSYCYYCGSYDLLDYCVLMLMQQCPAVPAASHHLVVQDLLFQFYLFDL